METQCTGEQLEFHLLGRRSVSARFEGGRISSEAGGLLLREVDKHTGLTSRVAGCFVDYSNPAGLERDDHELVPWRHYATACAMKIRATKAYGVVTLCSRCRWGIEM